VFGSDGPYFVDRDAPYWLAGLGKGKGKVEGISPLKPSTLPAAAIATKELFEVATTRPTIKALAIRAPGRTKTVTAAQLATWGRDTNVDVRRAAILISAEAADRTLIVKAVADPVADLRTAAALAIGFSQDPKLLVHLGKLVKDPEGKVKEQAAMSLMSFAIDEAAATMKANLATEFGPLFVNELARKDPKPYLSRLAEVIEKAQAPKHWWGGSIPWSVSWKILFAYLKGMSAAELGTAANTKLLDSMEKMKWFGSSEPTSLYALYVHTKMTARAKAFRDLIKKAVSWDNNIYFDMADKNPTNYLQ